MDDVLYISTSVEIHAAPDFPEASLVLIGRRHFHVFGLARQILVSLALASKSLTELLPELEASNDDGIDSSTYVAKVSTIITHLVDAGIITTNPATTGHGSAPESNIKVDRGHLSYLQLHLRLIPQAVTVKIANIGLRAFNPTCLRWLLPALAVFQLGCFYEYQRSVRLLLVHAAWTTWLFIALFHYLSLIFHEIGHASGSRRADCTPGEIGVGIYYFMPVFYVDFTSGWRVSALRRLFIDLGGVYFTAIYGGCAWAVFLFTHSAVAGAIGLLTGITIIVNVNPFIRMDGYWVMSDFLQTPNLMTLNRRMLQWIWQRLRGQKQIPTPAVISNRGKRYLYYGYFVASIMFNVYLIHLLLWIIWPHLIHDMLRNVATIAIVWHIHQWSPSTTRGVLQLIPEMLALLVVLVAMVKSAVRLIKYTKRLRHPTPSKAPS